MFHLASIYIYNLDFFIIVKNQALFELLKNYATVLEFFRIGCIEMPRQSNFPLLLQKPSGMSVLATENEHLEEENVISNL